MKHEFKKNKQDSNSVDSMLECVDKKINFNALLNKYGPEGLYIIADKLEKIADDDMISVLEMEERRIGYDVPVLSKDDLLKIGFEEIPHYTVTDALIYKLERNRHISVGCLGSPNEMVYICETDKKDENKITDLVSLHDWDFDGFLTLEKIKGLINLIDNKL